MISIVKVSTSSDLESLFRFRYRVYVEELNMTNQADNENKLLRDELDDYSISYAVISDGEILGSLRMTYLNNVPNPSYLINKFNMQPAIDKFGLASICTTSRFILDQKLRHGKVIYRLMQSAFVAAQEQNIRLNYGDCSPHLIPFYQHLGFRRYMHGYEDTAYGFKLPIMMLLEDYEFLDWVRSPLRHLVIKQHNYVETRNWFQQTYPHYQSFASSSLLTELSNTNKLYVDRNM
jgi:N-acyl-L-homoserine lactone synthetase